MNLITKIMKTEKFLEIVVINANTGNLIMIGKKQTLLSSPKIKKFKHHKIINEENIDDWQLRLEVEDCRGAYYE